MLKADSIQVLPFGDPAFNTFGDKKLIVPRKAVQDMLEKAAQIKVDRSGEYLAKSE